MNVNASQQAPGTGEDLTAKYLRIFGIGLLIAFFLPMIITHYRGLKVFFVNIEGLVGRGVPFLLRIELLYPLLAGIALLMIVKQTRSSQRALTILIVGLLPFLLLLISSDVRMAFGRILRDLPGGGALGIQAVVGHLGIMLILAGAHACRINPRIQLAASAAVLGSGLYGISLLIPVNGRFSLFDPIKIIFERDRSGVGFNIVTGLVGILVLAILILIIVKCFSMLKEGTDRAAIGESIIKWWMKIFLVLGFYLLYIIIVTIARGGKAGIFVTIIFAIIKFVPWVLGLYLLIPLSISEFILLSDSTGPVTASASPSPSPAQPYSPPGAPTPPPAQPYTPPSTPPTPAPQADKTMEERLQELSDMKQKGLISDEDYEKKKNDILSQL